MARIRRAQSYARRAPTKDPYDTVLVVCEGRKTEPNYLNGLKAAYRLSSANVMVTNAPGTDPMTIVTHTESKMAEDEYDRVFSVFDRDTHPNFNEAILRVRQSVRGRAGTWKAVTSTPCFELWLLLHFRYSTAPIVQTGQRSAGDMAERELRTFLPNYNKADGAIYERIAVMTEVGLDNALRLSKHNRTSGSDNPATDVHTLVDYLRNLKQA